jgi:hypothetical protein
VGTVLVVIERTSGLVMQGAVAAWTARNVTEPASNGGDVQA